MTCVLIPKATAKQSADKPMAMSRIETKSILSTISIFYYSKITHVSGAKNFRLK